MLSDVEKAFCVNSYISTKSFVQTSRLLIKKLGLDHRKLQLAPSNVIISKWVAKFRGGKLFQRKKRQWEVSIRQVRGCHG